MGFQDFGDFGHPRHPAIRTTGLLTFALAGLSPAEHTSVYWSQHADKDPLARLERLGHHKQLGKILVLELLVERQIEARRTLAHEARDVGNIGILQQSLSSRFASCSVSAKEEPSGSQRSTRTSGRFEVGKNCLGMKAKAPMLATSVTKVSATTVLRRRTHQPTMARTAR